MQVAVRGGQHADVDVDRLARADPLERFLLQHPQQLGLQRQIDLGDLVQQDRAAVGRLEAARAGGVGPRKGALFVAEQARFP